jgi:hypothetical protein
MRKIRSRKIPVAAACLDGMDLEYSIVVRDLLNSDGNAVGEIYGVGIRGMGDFAEMLDLTTHWKSICDFTEKLSVNTVTPVTLRDVVVDSLPL